MDRNIIHLQLGNKHYYYGSPASMYDKHSSQELGLTQASLNNYFSRLKEGDEAVYINKLCVIRKGVMYVKPSTRGRKKKVDDPR